MMRLIFRFVSFLLFVISFSNPCPSSCGSTLNPQRGYCNTSSIVSTCICLDGFQGFDCSERTCPSGPTWFGMPEPPTYTTSASHPHRIEVCSNRGICSPITGSCICDSDFEGEACERSRCPVGEINLDELLATDEKRITPCSGHGRCVSMRNAGRDVRGVIGSRASVLPKRSSTIFAKSRSEVLVSQKTESGLTQRYFSPRYLGSQAFRVDYDEWESDRIFGCVCDDGFIGPACEHRTCPLGTDPHFRGKPDTQSLTIQLPVSRRLKSQSQSVREVQRIYIHATGGTSSELSGIGGKVDVDEVQQIVIESVGARPFGSFTLSLDCRPKNTFQTYFGDLYKGEQGDDVSPVIIRSPSQNTSFDLNLTNSTLNETNTTDTISNVRRLNVLLQPSNLTLNTTNRTNTTNTTMANRKSMLQQPPGCLHWGKGRRIVSMSPEIHFPSDITLSAADVANKVADSIKETLETLPNINASSQISVISNALNLTTENVFRFEFKIIFYGDKVGGDLPQMLLDATGVFAGSGGSIMSSRISTIRDGSDLRGFLNISWDDRESVPNVASLQDVSRNCTTDYEDTTVLASMGFRSTSIPIESDPIEFSDAIMRLVFGCPPSPAPIWRTVNGNASDVNWKVYLSAADFASSLSASHCTEPPPMPWDAATEDEVNNFPAIKVEMRKMINGGLDLELIVSFLRGIRTRGDVAPLRISSESLKIYSPSDKIISGDIVIDVQEIIKGEFIDPKSTWNFAIPYKSFDGTSHYSPPLGPFPWCVDASYVEAKITSFNFLGFGLINVSRSRWIPDPLSISISGRNISSLNVTIDDSTSEWRGEYRWKITFLSLAEDVDLVSTISDGTFLYLQGGSSLESGSLGSLVIQKEQSGSSTVPTNEVQLIDCICSLEGFTLPNGTIIPAYLSGGCSSPSLHYIRLSFLNAITEPIPYSATAEQVRQALAALPTIPDVVVQMYDRNSVLERGDRNSAEQLCDSNGVTTAITFAWNPGPQEALIIHENELPQRSDIDVSHAPTIGRFGGRARVGTHRLEPCSGRGACSSKTGECDCFGDGVTSMYTASDNGAWPDAQPGTLGSELDRGSRKASEYVPPSEIIRNCATPTPPITKCPGVTLGLSGSTSLLAPGVTLVILLGGGGEGECSTHGTCSGSPFFTCICDAGFTGAACELDVRQCGLGPAWFDIPSRKGESFNSFNEQTATIDTHRLERCSTHGNCNEGKCDCYGHWAGKACELSPCPAAELQPPSPLVTPALMKLSTADYRKASQSNDCGNKMPCVTMNILARGVIFESTFFNTTVGATAVGLFAATASQASISSQIQDVDVDTVSKDPHILVLDLMLRPTTSIEYISAEGGNALLQALSRELGVPQGGLVISSVYLGDSEEQVSLPFSALCNSEASLQQFKELWMFEIKLKQLQEETISVKSYSDFGNNFLLVRCLILERIFTPLLVHNKTFQHMFGVVEGQESLRDRLPKLLNSSLSPFLQNLEASWGGIIGAQSEDIIINVSGILPDISGFQKIMPPTAADVNAAASQDIQSDKLEKGRFLYTSWDANMIRGCACDIFGLRSAGRYAQNYARPTASYDCRHFRCPLGADPQEVAAVRRNSKVPRDVFSITCTAGAGRIRFALQGTWTRWLNFDSSVADADTGADEYVSGGLNFESALRSINTSVPFIVSWGASADEAAEAEEDGMFASDIRSISQAADRDMTGFTNEKSRQLCNMDGLNTFFVIFLGGGLNKDNSLGLLIAELDDFAAGSLGDVLIEEISRAGSERRYECNRRGTCDRSTGACKCEPGYGSSDGQGQSGQLGDCGVKVFVPK